MNTQLSDLLPINAIDLLRQRDIRYSVSYEGGDYYCAELEWWSKYGGDKIFSVLFEFDCTNEDLDEAKRKALQSFSDALEEIYEGYDVDEEVRLWLGNSSKCSLSARQLVEDSEDTERTLKELSDETKQLCLRI